MSQNSGEAAQQTEAAAAMSSTGGLPPTGACLALRVTRVDPPRPGSVLVRLWGRFQQRERQPEYQRLHSEIQTWAKAVRLGGGPGRGVPAPPLETNERCLAEICGEWHRARVLSRVGDDYTVFTLDEGRALPVRARSLDRGIGLNICLEEENKIPSGASLGVMNEESSSLILQSEFELAHQVHQCENEHQDTKSSCSNNGMDVSEKEMVVSEVHCEKDDGQTVPSITDIKLDKEQLIHGTNTEVTDTVLPSTKSDVALLEHFIDQKHRLQLMPFVTLPASEKISKFENLSDSNLEANVCMTEGKSVDLLH